MPDVLIRDLPEEVLTALDARAVRLGLSRTEYLRRRLTQDAARAQTSVSVDDLAGFSRAFSALADQEVMSRAWR